MKVVSNGDGPLLHSEFAGDEPFLLARRNPLLTVIVAVERKNGVAKAVREHGAEVILLDDGFQHLAVKRDLDIVLLDADNPLGNGKVLPAGPLREFPAALKRGNLFVLTRAQKSLQASIDLPGEVLSCRHEVSSHAVSLDGEGIKIDSLIGRRGGAFAGIAVPEKFFADLKKVGLNIEKTAVFPDHVNYGKMEWMRLDELGRDMDYLITTEKDAVKLSQEDLPIICYAVPLTLEFLKPGKLEAILDDLFL
jgi:tetraacyldisaccharide 4'-kinase